MWHLLYLCGLFVLASARPEKNSSLRVQTRCVQNLLLIQVEPVTGRRLELAAVYNGSVLVLTQTLASQCGFSSSVDSSGTARIHASLLNCFSQNKKDQEFRVELLLRLSPDEVHTVTETCVYTDWAPREVLCHRDYMEVSVQRVLQDDQLLPKSFFYGTKSADPRRAAEKKQEELSFPFTTVRFFSQSGGHKTMDVSSVLSRGYSLSLTHSRMVLRSPLSTAETYVQQVSGVSMTVLRTSTLFGRKWLSSQIHAAVACPLLTGSVSFSDGWIRWFLPREITPLLSSGHYSLLDVWLGVNGARLEAAEAQARGFFLSVDDTHVMVDIPIGAKGGYYKSVVQDGLYLTSYRVEPMLELLWTEDVTNEDTRYRVLLPISTPPLDNPPQVTHSTEPTQHVFKLSVGPFAPDVVLLNISFPSETLTLDQAMSRGFRVQEQVDQERSLKSFSVYVPHTDRGVHATKERGQAVFSAELTFGFMVLPELQSFSVSAALTAQQVDSAPPSVPPSALDYVSPSAPPSPTLSAPPSASSVVTGECDEQNFHVWVGAGSERFRVLVGRSTLTPSLAKIYQLTDSGVGFSLTVPLLAPDVIYEAMVPKVIRARLEVTLLSPDDDRRITDFSLSCSFSSRLTACYPNGTITVLALKLEAVPGLDLGQLTLADPRCRPVFNNERYAFFSFTASSCGTVRKFVRHMMVYENDIALPDDQLEQRLAENKEPEYHLKVKCVYDTNATHQLSYQVRPLGNEPVAEVSKGTLHMNMRMARDSSFTNFYTDEDFPLSVSQQKALWFEVELMPPLGNKVSVELERCWVTEDQDKTATPLWSFIHNGCVVQDSPLQVHVIPVRADSRVSVPAQFKRFTLHLGSFIQQQASPQVFVHCDVVVCDPRNPLGGACAGQCTKPAGPSLSAEVVSTGPIFVS